MRSAIAFAALSLAACSSLPLLPQKTPEQRAQEAAAERFDDCMDATLGSFGPFHYGSQEARLKAAEICNAGANNAQTQAKQ